MWACRWGVLATMAALMVTSVVMAANVDGVRKKHSGAAKQDAVQ